MDAARRVGSVVGFEVASYHRALANVMLMPGGPDAGAADSLALALGLAGIWLLLLLTVGLIVLLS